VSVLRLPRSLSPAAVVTEAIAQGLRQAALTVQELRAIERELELIRGGWHLRAKDVARLNRFLDVHGDTLAPELLDAAHTALLEILQGGIR
jgi:hypothetical protein